MEKATKAKQHVGVKYHCLLSQQWQHVPFEPSVVVVYRWIENDCASDELQNKDDIHRHVPDETAPFLVWIGDSSNFAIVKWTKEPMAMFQLGKHDFGCWTRTVLTTFEPSKQFEASTSNLVFPSLFAPTSESTRYEFQLNPDLRQILRSLFDVAQYFSFNDLT